MSEISKASTLLPSLGLFSDTTLIYNSTLSERENLPVSLTFLGFSDQFIMMECGLDVFWSRVPKTNHCLTKISETCIPWKVFPFGH